MGLLAVCVLWLYYFCARWTRLEANWRGHFLNSQNLVYIHKLFMLFCHFIFDHQFEKGKEIAAATTATTILIGVYVYLSNTTKIRNEWTFFRVFSFTNSSQYRGGDKQNNNNNNNNLRRQKRAIVITNAIINDVRHAQFVYYLLHILCLFYMLALLSLILCYYYYCISFIFQFQCLPFWIYAANGAR